MYFFRIQAEADSSKSLSDRADSCILGLIPHQIRGFLTHFNQLLLIAYAYPQCSACSESVLSEFDRQGIDFLIHSLKNPTSLEDISGLTALKQVTETEIDQWDEDLQEINDNHHIP